MNEKFSFHYPNPRKNASDSPPPPPSSEGEDKVRGLPVFVVVILLLSLGAGIAGGGIGFLLRMTETLPTIEELENIEQPLVSKMIGRDGKVVHEFSTERRFWVSLEEIPKDLTDAVVAIEDRRFYKHWGIDLKRIFGAIMVDVLHGEYAQGASTLTQQLARNLYLTSRTSLVRKIREVLTAIQIESYYTKKEILELYLNQVYLGGGTYGVEAASQKYFNKPVSELTLNQCAILAGTIQLPEHYRPDKEKNISRITVRRNSVIRGMQRMGVIDEETAQSARQDSIKANPKKPSVKSAPYFVDMVRGYVAQRYGDKALYEGGLTIYTTVDPPAQDSSSAAAKAHLAELQPRLNMMCVDSSKIYRTLGIPRDTLLAHFDSLYEVHEETFDRLPDSIRLRKAQVSVVALDVKTGAILTLIGGRDFNETKFNRAIQSHRQPGSAFKPIVYAAAVESSYTAASVILDQPITLETDEGLWRPENYGHEFYGPVTLRRALAKSINLPAIQVLTSIGASRVVEVARRMGISSNLAAVPSLAIGACEVIPLEITSAYSIFPNGGVRSEPYYIEKIVDKNGKVLEEHSPTEHEVFSPEAAYIMSDLLREVVCCGTGASIPGSGFRRVAGGKTGTTNDYSDAWFIGFTPQIACGVWVGVDERRSMGHGVTGARGAIPIWVPTMSALHKELPKEIFERPEGVVAERICEKSHKRATRYCVSAQEEVFREDNVPEACEVHGPGRRRRKSTTDNFGAPARRDRGSSNGKRPLMF